jgi:hypothetical protein
MKKSQKKLHLSRETLRDLKHARAAADPEPTKNTCAVGSTISGQLCCATTDSAAC